MSVKINADIPGGNVIVLHSNEQETILKKDLRDSAGNWFYWCFRAEFDQPGTHTFRFEPSESPAVGTRGPAISADNGLTWRWAEPGTWDIKENFFRYHYDGEKEKSLIFCLSMQYQKINLETFLEEYASSPYLKTSVLCRSRKGREVPLLRIADPERKPEHKLLLTSRHHCCEMTATYVLEGMLREALENPEFRNRIAISAVPFTDMDGVIDGDQGKNRKPHDHARDYGEHPIYPETKSIMNLVLREKMDLVFDIHCPWIYQGCNEFVYFVGPRSKRMEEGTLRLSERIESDPERTVPYATTDMVRYGTLWNTNANYTQGQTLAQWSGDLTTTLLATSIEIPYANTRDFTFCANSWRSFGRTLARGFATLFA